MEATLDKIVGSSPMNRNLFCMHHLTGVCAFASGGFLSLINVASKQRHDFSVDPNSDEIDALCFSPVGRQIAVGIQGPNAKILILSFNESFNSIIERTEIKTKENGFSCVAIDSKCGKLLSVGSDSSPFILLWNINVSKPEAIGYYHLAVKPNAISIAQNGLFGIVSGPKLLKLIDISAEPKNEPVPLLSRNINIGRFKGSNYVAAFSSPNVTEKIYALTDDGVLLTYDKSCVVFKKKSPVSCSRIILDCGSTQAMVVDSKIVLVGNDAGTMIAVRWDGQMHTIIGKFSSNGYPVVAVSCSERIVGGAYSSGQMLFFPRRPDRPPVLSIPSHRGPVCAISTSANSNDEFIYSAGSDGTLRKWELVKHQELVSGSSQSQVAAKKISRTEEDYLISLKGVRSLVSTNNLVFAGDNHGCLHMLNSNNLEELMKIDEKSGGTIALALHPDGKLLASGGIDGKIRLYSFTESKLLLIITDPSHTSPVTAITFTADYLISSSKEGIIFATMPSIEPFITAKVDDLPLDLVTLNNKKYIVSSGMNCSVCIWRVCDGTIYRKFQLSMDIPTTSIAVDMSGLFLAVGMGDTTVHILDIFSGEILLNFKSNVGMITSIKWHQNDIILSGMTGCFSIWNIPDILCKAIADKMKSNSPLEFILADEDEKEPETSILLAPSKANRLVSSCTLKSSDLEKNCQFSETKNEESINKIEVINAEEEEGEEEKQQDEIFNAPRPVFGEKIKRADDIIRASFAKHGDEEKDEEYSPSNSTKESIMEIVNNIQKKIEEDNKQFILIEDDPKKPRQKIMSVGDENIENPSIIKGLEENEQDPFIIVDDFIKPSPPQSPRQTDEASNNIEPNLNLNKEDSDSLPINIPPKAGSQPVTISELSPIKPTPTLKKKSEIIQLTQHLKEILLHANELIELKTTNEEELKAIENLKKNMTEIHETALQSKWLKDKLQLAVSQIFEPKN